MAQIGAASGREIPHKPLTSVLPKSEAELGLALDQGCIYTLTDV
jgi:hypothetical protein